MSDTEPVYHSAPDHDLEDLIQIHARGFAIPFDGDHYTIYYSKTKEKP